MSSFYSTSADYLYDELKRLSLLVRLKINRQRHSKGNELRGLVITEEEIDSLLDESVQQVLGDDEVYGITVEDASLLAAIKEKIETNLMNSRSLGQELRLDVLSKHFQLSSLEFDILLVAMAPEVDLRFEKYFAYLQDDVTKKRPSIDLCMSLLSESAEQKIEVRRRLMRNEPLIKYRIIHLFDDPSHSMPPLLSKYIKLDDSIVNYLLELEDDNCAPFINLEIPRCNWADVSLPDEFKDRLRVVTDKYKDENQLIFYFQGLDGLGKKGAAEAICRELDHSLLVADVEKLLRTPSSEIEDAIRLVYREALLRKAAVYWYKIDLLLSEDSAIYRNAFFDILRENSTLSFVSGRTADLFLSQLHGLSCVHVEFPRLSSETRRIVWEQFLINNREVIADEVDLEAISNEFKLTRDQIQAAASMAVDLAFWRSPNNSQVTREDIYTACRRQSNPNLATLARKISPHYKWNDIILPDDQLEQLREIYNTVKYKTLVYETWGFERKLTFGKGVAILFSGPAGTGKTMAAEVLANELGLDLYQIDLSQVVSKYIGETEKNLGRIFDEAETSNAILCFNEADAIFGKRSEVRDAHDRYANIEIGYLLQKMEEYEGVTILTTNLRRNMDDAFVRRIAFLIHFNLPGVEERRRIWEKIWPEEVPRAQDLDLDFMARQFELPGGNIKNIALASAFLAASNGKVVDMSHLITATRRELRKKGKMVVEQNFGSYSDQALRLRKDGRKN